MIMTNGILLTARLILAATFLPSAVAHLSNISGLAAKISAMGFPYGEVIAAAVTLTEAVAPLAVVIGLVPRLSACTLLIASLVTTGILCIGSGSLRVQPARSSRRSSLPNSGSSPPFYFTSLQGPAHGAGTAGGAGTDQWASQ